MSEAGGPIAGISELALWVRDAVSGPVNFPNGRRSCFLEDPDDHYIELTDR